MRDIVVGGYPEIRITDWHCTPIAGTAGKLQKSHICGFFCFNDIVLIKSLKCTKNQCELLMPISVYSTSLSIFLLQMQ